VRERSGSGAGSDGTGVTICQQDGVERRRSHGGRAWDAVEKQRLATALLPAPKQPANQPASAAAASAGCSDGKGDAAAVKHLRHFQRRHHVQPVHAGRPLVGEAYLHRVHIPY
jgi:hypothetical protein